MTKAVAFLFLAGLLYASLVSSAQSVKWTYPLDGPPISPTLFPDEINPSGVLACSSFTVALVDATGKAVWMAKQKSAIASPASVADLDGDEVMDIVVGLTNGDVICLDENGNTQWNISLGPPLGEFKIPSIADLLPNPGLEIVIGCDDGILRCLDSDGNILWSFFGDKFRVSPTAIGDVDRDGAPEIIYGTDNGHVYCLSAYGQVEWCYFENAPYGRSGPNLADLNGDGRVEILITRSNVGIATCLMALDGATGTFLWRTQDVMQGYVSNATVDLDGDGTLETLHADKGNHIYCVNSDGAERWRTMLNGRGVYWAPAVGDIDGDGHVEIIVGVRGSDPSDGSTIFVLDEKGAVTSKVASGSSANVAPAIGDLDHDGVLDVIVGSEGPNVLQALNVETKTDTNRNVKETRVWPSFRGNSRMTGSATNVPQGEPQPFSEQENTGKISIDNATDYWGDNSRNVSWDSPAPEGSFIEVSVGPSDRETAVTALSAGATSLKVSFQIREKTHTRVTLRMLRSGVAQPLVVSHFSVNPKEPNYCDRAVLTEKCETAIQKGSSIGADTRYLRTGLNAIDSQIREITESVPSSAPSRIIAEKATQLRVNSDRLKKLSTVLDQAWSLGDTGSFACWQDANPWDSFDPAELPDTFDVSPQVVVTAFGDEFEDAALSLLNTGSHALEVRCAFSKGIAGQAPVPEPEIARHITLRRGIRVPARFSGYVLDALPELDDARVVTLPQGEAVQVWLTVNTAGLEPGSHSATLYVRSLETEETCREIPIEIRVWPIKLPRNVHARINWSSSDPAATSDQALQDMLDHGITVAYAPATPSIAVNGEGAVSGAVDWSKFDAAMARLPDYFQVLFFAPPARTWLDGITAAEDSPLWEQGFKTSVRALAEHMEKLGWGYNRWAFYPVDEPWNTGETLIPQLRRFCTRVKEADPKARNYTDPAGYVRAEKLEEFKDLIDVWQPETNLLKRDPKLVDWFRKNAKTLWTYEAPGPGKDLLPLGHFRGYAWLAWMFGVQGSGFWVYYSDENWPATIGIDYSVVYKTNDRIVPSRRWQAARDGVEDYRMLYVLNEAIAHARTKGDTASADKAQALLDEAVEKTIAWQARTIDEITRMTRDYELDYNLLMEYRTKIAEEIIRLNGEI